MVCWPQWTQQNRIKASVFSCVKHVQALRQCCMITVGHVRFKDSVCWQYITLTNKTDWLMTDVCIYSFLRPLQLFRRQICASSSHYYLECSIECLLQVVRLQHDINTAFKFFFLSFSEFKNCIFKFLCNTLKIKILTQIFQIFRVTLSSPGSWREIIDTWKP